MLALMMHYITAITSTVWVSRCIYHQFYSIA